jgi:hypothetical protein
MEWRTIESAPKDGTKILLLVGDVAIGGGWVVNGCKPDRSGWEVVTLGSHGCGCCGGGFEKPTHWMPLPVKP